MSQTIKDAIKQLESEILSKQTAIMELKRMVGVDAPLKTPSVDDLPHSTIIESGMNKPFPINGNTDKKIIYLFKEVFQKGQRMSEIQNTLNKYNGSELRADNVVRRMKDNGQLFAVRYNNQNKMSFWGLKDWINFDEEEFKESYKPKDSELPLNVTHSEVLLSNKKEDNRMNL